MLYRIGNKFYVKVGGYYKEVDIKVDGSNLNITPNGNEIEINDNLKVTSYDMRVKKDEVIKLLDKPKRERIEEVEEKPYRNYGKSKRM